MLTAEARAQSQPSETSPIPVERLRPDVYYLRDSTGKLVPVPGLSLEEYQRWLDQQPTGPLPLYAINNVNLLGKLVEDRAEVEVRVDLRVDRIVGDALRIPLKFSPAILQDYRYEGPGIAAMGFDRRQSSYVLWLRCGPATRHSATFRLLVPVRRTGDQQRLDLELPDALTHIELLVPFARVDYSVEGTQYLVKSPVSLGSLSSKLEMDGYGGQFSLRVRPRSETPTAGRPFLQAIMQVLLVVEDPSYIRAEAQIAVQSEQAPWDRFHLRLPMGMTLQPREAPGYAVEVVEAGSATSGPLVAISRTANSERAAALVLAGEVRRLTADAPWEAAAFDIPEAYYQRTELTVRVEGGWAVRPTQMRQVRRIASLSMAERQQGVIAKFTYVMNRTQPPSLRLLIQPQQSIVAVEPHYYVRFAGQRAWLDMYLRFRVRGAAAKGFALWTGDWIVRRIQPQDWLDAEPVQPSEDPRSVTVFLDPSKLPGSGNFDLHIAADAPIDLSRTDPTLFSLPLPQASTAISDQTLTILPAVVVLESSPELELTPAPSLMPEILPAQARAADWLTAQLPETLAGGTRFVFQAVLGAEPLRLACLVRSRPARINVQSEVALKPTPSDIEVQQQLNLEIQYQPLTAVVLEWASLPSSPTIHVQLDGEPITLDEGMVQADRRRWIIPLAVPWLANHAITVTFRMPRPSLPSDGSGAVSVPLVVLAADLPLAQSATRCRLEDGQPGSPWRIEETRWQPVAQTRGNVQEFLTDGLASTITLQPWPETRRQHTTVVHRAWIQSICSGLMRVDRAVFRVESDASQLQVRVPAGVAPRRDEVWIAINGRHASNWTWKGPDTIEIARSESDARQMVIEVWYATDTPPMNLAGKPIELARLDNVSGLYPIYWELVVPNRYHLLGYSRPLIPQFRWQWQWTHTRRANYLTPRQLEDWTGAVHAPELPEGVNRYLFSCVGSLPEVKVTLLGRGWLVLLASSLVLSVAWMWNHWLWSRRVVVIGSLLLLVLVVAWQPDLAVLAAQSAVLGVFAWLALQLARYVFFRPPGVARPARLSSVTRVEPEPVALTAATVSAGELYAEWSSEAKRP